MAGFRWSTRLRTGYLPRENGGQVVGSRAAPAWARALVTARPGVVTGVCVGVGWVWGVGMEGLSVETLLQSEPLELAARLPGRLLAARRRIRQREGAQR